MGSRENKSVDKNLTWHDISKELFGAYLTKNKLMENYKNYYHLFLRKQGGNTNTENRWDEITVKDILVKILNI